MIRQVFTDSADKGFPDVRININFPHTEAHRFFDALIGYSRRAVQDDRTGNEFIDFLKPLKIEPGLPLVAAMGRANGDGQGVYACLFDKALRLFGIGEKGFSFADTDIVFGAADFSQLSLNGNSRGMGNLHHFPGQPDILLKGILRAVNHY